MRRVTFPVLVTCLLVAACGNGSPSTPTAAPPKAGSADINVQPRAGLKPGGSVRMSIEQWITQFNYFQADNVDGDGQWVGTLLEPQLWRVDADGVARANPDVLASAQVSATSPEQVVTYRINPKAVWSDGRPITWQDFATQWADLNGTNPAYLVSTTTGYDQIGAVARGADDREVKITFRKPFADWQLLFNPLLPSVAMDTPDKFNKGWIDKAPVYGGPWKIGTADKTTQTLSLVPNPTYWGTKPVLDTLILRALDSSALTDAFLNNEIDLAPARQPDAYKRLAGAANTVIRIGGRWDETHLTLNSTGALADVHVRQAISEALNRPAIATAQSSGLPFKVNILDNHFFMPTQQGYQDNSGPYGHFDLSAAKTLLDQAGWTAASDSATRTKDGKQLTLDYIVPSGSTSQVPQLVQNMLAQAGVKVNLHTVPANDYSDKYLNNGSFDLASFRNVDEVFTSALLPTFVSKGDQNFGKVGTDQIDQLLNTASTSTDRKRSIAAYNQADTLIWQQGHSIELFQTPQIDAVRAGLANFGAYGLSSDDQLVDTGWTH